ncbi:hypothetical protein M3Y98_01010600 [Aphelenchoides besseyi]|nr:hypothetical protein M3Y98_01010600 [Aphelenchoides besseyi]KAI6210167.1 hypothetical protein M3Y96_00299000 [Aphelenchoides besseyi]
MKLNCCSYEIRDPCADSAFPPMSVTLISFFLLLSYGIVDATQCYHCSYGKPEEIVKLLGLYSNAETAESLVQSTALYNEKCGTNQTSTLKVLNCKGSCMIADSVSGKAVMAGCARIEEYTLGHSTRIDNNEHFRMAMCTNDECNESYDTAKDNREKKVTTKTTVLPTNSTKTPIKVPTTTAVPLLANGDKKSNASTVNPKHPKTVKPPRPSSASSTAASIGVLAVGLAVFYTSN